MAPRARASSPSAGSGGDDAGDLYDDLIDQIREIAIHVDGVADTEKCQVRKVGMRYFIDLHIEVNGDISVRHGHDIAHALKAKLMSELPELADVLMHVEPKGE